MLKEREVTVIQKYKVCDYCGEEITDHSSIVLESTEDDTIKHFHSMKSGGKKGTVKETCIELFEKEQRKWFGLVSQSPTSD